MIQLIGDLPCDFSSGTAIIRVKPNNETFSYITLEAEFINQITSFLISNTSDKTIHLSSKTPIAFLNLRSIGYFNPPSATQTLAHQMPVYTYVTHFNSLFNVSIHRYLPDPEPTMCTTDPYPWLDSSDPQRFQTDREILESAIDLSQSYLTKTQCVEFYDILEEYKDAFSLYDEIGLAPNMQINLELLDKSPFFI